MTTEDDENKPARQIFDASNKHHLGAEFKNNKGKKIKVIRDEVYYVLFPPRRKKSESEEGENS